MVFMIQIYTSSSLQQPVAKNLDYTVTLLSTLFSAIGVGGMIAVATWETPSVLTGRALQAMKVSSRTH
jgi:hypothetical protein